jgi:prepilin-type N-terminal cleavage/methylation domain-containing protein
MTAVKQKGFSLIELLVVVAILAILAALLFPLTQTIKRSAERSVCLANLRKIGSGFHSYLGDNNYKIFPRGAQGGSENYISYIYQYLPEDKIYRCPSTKTPTDFTQRTYKINSTSAPGKGWLYERSYFDIQDRDNTIFVFDRGDTGKRKLFVRDTVEWDYAADVSPNPIFFQNYPCNHAAKNEGINLLFVGGNARFEKYPFKTDWYYPR